MKIIEIIPQLSSGGGERFTVDLCNKLAESDEVTLVVLHSVEETGFYARELSPHLKIVSMRKKRGMDFGLFWKVLKLIRRERPDIVHTHLRAILYVFLAALLYKRPRYFHTVHNDAEKEAGDKLSLFVRRLCFRCGLIVPVAISGKSLQSFEAFYGMTAPLIYNGRDVPSNLKVTEAVRQDYAKIFRPTAKTKVLVNLARIDKVKRQTLLAKVAKRLEDEGFDFTLLLIGSTKHTALVDQIEANHCDSLHILGEKNNPLEYLKMSDAYCLPSSYEGLPISLIEAIGVGTIPICTPVGGIVDIVHDGQNGLLTRDLSEEALYEVLKKFLNMDEAATERMKKLALESYPAYSMKECAEKYKKLFAKSKS